MFARSFSGSKRIWACLFDDCLRCFQQNEQKLRCITLEQFSVLSCDAQVARRIFLIDENNSIEALLETLDISTVICKDVLEHLTFNEVNSLLNTLSARSSSLFVAVPLSLHDDESYIISSYENDITHVLRKSQSWWAKLFEDCGYDILFLTTTLKGIKENWTNKYPHGNLFAYLKSTRH